MSRLLDEKFITGFLERNLSRLNLSSFRLSRCRILPLKLSKTGGKSVIEFKLDLASKDGGQKVTRSLIGVWRPDSRNERVYRLLHKLRRLGFDSGDCFQVCQPVAYFGDWNLLLTSKARGSELEDILEKGDRELLAPSIAQAARWLAELHTTKLTSVLRKSSENEEKVLGSWSQHLKRIYPHAAQRLRRLTRQILDREESYNPRKFVLIHGDFHPENIFIDDATVTVTDFERSRVFDPAQDVGYFLGQFTRKAHSGKYQEALRNDGALRKVFLKEYARNGSLDAPERVSTYEARTYMEILHYVYWGLEVDPNPADIETSLTRAEECIEAHA